MVEFDIEKALIGTTCEVTIPSETNAQDLEAVVSRWSSLGVSEPHAIVTPYSDIDISQVIEYASKHHLKVVPTTGGHGSFIPITKDTIYLSMAQFKHISLDEKAGTVAFCGGVLTGDLMKALGDKGYYTCVPNSNHVGMVGALLGALQGATISIHGLGIDNIEEITVIPFQAWDGTVPRELVLRRDETDADRRRLWDVLCGAGLGFGVVTAVKMKMWPTKDLGLTGMLLFPRIKPSSLADTLLDDKVWQRNYMFAPNAVDAAARAYLSLTPPPPHLKPNIVILRAPPGTPHPGAPLVLVALSYFGRSVDAERVVDELIDQEAASQAVAVIPGASKFGNLNDPFAPMSRHGGIKEFEGGFIKELTVAGLLKTFGLLVAFTEKDMSTRSSTALVVSGWNPDKVREIGQIHPTPFFSARERERGFFVQVTPWYTSAGEREEVGKFCDEVYEALREGDIKEGRDRVSFFNNTRWGADMRVVFTEDQMEEIKAVKKLWDRDDIGWNPVTNGWPSL
jgi:hypothetical protein